MKIGNTAYKVLVKFADGEDYRFTVGPTFRSSESAMHFFYDGRIISYEKGYVLIDGTFVKEKDANEKDVKEFNEIYKNFK